EIGREYGIKNVIVPYDGCVLNLSQQTPQIIDKVPTGILAVDGNKLIPIDGIVYKQRESLSSCGAVSVCVRYHKGTIKLVDMQYFGIFENSELEEIQDLKNDIASEIKLSLENTARGSTDERNIESSIERIIRVAFMNARGKKPVVFVHVIGF
ncbi:MAG: hypothetical protein LBB12_04315, partial [Holosporaceae bacterium]|nr:hypothetical protein [Holosporaceae bacterium]